jgi:hypothetical protein
MSEPTNGRDLTFTVVGNKLGVIRGTEVPGGMMAVPGVEDVAPEGRVVTQRALAMTDGLFRFAENSNQKDPSAPPEAQ